VYRRGDVERVLRLKHLLFVEGLTLAGARRRLEEERTPLPDLEEPAPEEAPRRKASQPAEMALRQRLSTIKQGLRSILDLLERGLPKTESFELRAEADAAPRARKGNGKPPKASAKVVAAKSKNGGSGRSRR
jgi:hypothetical protein